MPAESPTDPQREQIHALLQLLGPFADDPTPDDLTGSPVLVKWALICDWMDEAGERWLTQTCAVGMPSWEQEGLFHAALAYAGDDEEL